MNDLEFVVAFFSDVDDNLAVDKFPLCYGVTRVDVSGELWCGGTNKMHSQGCQRKLYRISISLEDVFKRNVYFYVFFVIKNFSHKPFISLGGVLQ